MAKQLFDGSESFGAFMALMEALTGQDFVAFVRSIMSRTIMEVILLAGSAPAWAAPGAGGGAPGALVGSAGVGAGVPDSVASRASSMLHGLSGISCDDEGGAGGLPAEEFLAEGDHVTRMVKEFGDRMDMRLPSAARPSMSPADTAAVLTMLRCVALLITLTGRFIGRFLPQVREGLGCCCETCTCLCAHCCCRGCCSVESRALISAEGSPVHLHSRPDSPPPTLCRPCPTSPLLAALPACPPARS